MRTIKTPKSIKVHLDKSMIVNNSYSEVRKRITALEKGMPEVSVVIPAYNEEKTLLNTLSSISLSSTLRSTEVIVVDNNSNDRTGEIAKSVGVRYIHESTKGYMHARNAGLFAARGKYILNADADSLYPPGWIDVMVKPIESNNDIALVYGRCSFFSSTNRPRWIYYFYEVARDISVAMTKKIKDEAMFVMGANSSFLKESALRVNGFTHPPGTNEDGYLAVKLRNYGRLYYNAESIIWTSDRRLVEEGSMAKSYVIRITRFLSRFSYWLRRRGKRA